ncbi:hypothetical protein BD289DRAFT_248931 [Coniella lustricola]|uniref:Uncharacterized protein n=1 Tax=Coniella lustricola TaxID=2025994 RepID=A0A2T3A8U6_9PEZI|nr:hypothetical protein BD289DRAFT_248931 [Coniella lustricola]
MASFHLFFHTSSPLPFGASGSVSGLSSLMFSVGFLTYTQTCHACALCLELRARANSEPAWDPGVEGCTNTIQYNIVMLSLPQSPTIKSLLLTHWTERIGYLTQARALLHFPLCLFYLVAASCASQLASLSGSASRFRRPWTVRPSVRASIEAAVAAIDKTKTRQDKKSNQFTRKRTLVMAQVRALAPRSRAPSSRTAGLWAQVTCAVCVCVCGRCVSIGKAWHIR